MDSGTLSGIVTVVCLATFIGIVWWAYSKGNKQRFEEDGKLPFADDDATARQGDKQ